MAYRPKLDYSIRPAKNIERKMIAEALTRLRHFDRVESYQYVGMGGLYFGDFTLFHRTLNFSSMLSLERPEYEESRVRFESNKPFRPIEVQFSEPSGALPSISKDSPVIVWLDYEDTIHNTILDDVGEIAFQVTPGSVLIATVNAHIEPARLRDVDLIPDLKDDLGDRLPAELHARDLRGDWDMARLSRRLIVAEIERALSTRSGGPAGTELHFRQLFNFHYRDGTRMLTVGGLVHRASQEPTVGACDFGSLDFVKSGEDAYLIEVPRLTLRERTSLNAVLPKFENRLTEIADSIGVPREDAEQYARIYRYFPSFAESDL